MTAIDPAAALFNLSTAYWASRCLHVIAELGVADVLGDAPQTAAELARSTNSDPRALHRVMRALVNHGIFELQEGRFSHNASSRLLRTDAEGSMRPRARLDGLAVHWAAYGALPESLKTGRSGMELVAKQGLFEYLRGHPEDGHIFADAMVSSSFARVRQIVAAYDFRGHRVVADIGGGLGNLLKAVLDTDSQSRGILFDLPKVIEQAQHDADPRISYAGGDFFRDPIPAADLYMLMNVLHDWSDEESIEILRGIRNSAPPGSKVLLLEGVVEEGMTGEMLIDIDVEMLVMTTGRERTLPEWQAVLTGAGLSPQRTLPGGPWNKVIEAVVP
jgi:hypothetical protein